MGNIYTVDLKNYDGCDIGDNTIICDPNNASGWQSNNTVEFRGSGNILYIEEGVTKIKNTHIVFEGDNALIYMSKSRHNYCFTCNIGSNSFCCFRRNIFMNSAKPLTIDLSGGRSLMIGDDCLFSLKIDMNSYDPTTDSHRDILIGNHVWLGQNLKINGGTVASNNSIIGANTTVDGQCIPSYTCWATRNGELVQVLDSVVFGKDSVRNNSRKEKKYYRRIHPKYLKEIMALSEYDMREYMDDLSGMSTAEERLGYIIDISGKSQYKRPKYKAPVKNEPETAEQTDTPLPDNRIIGRYTETGDNSSIVFGGKGNVLYIEDGVVLHNTKIYFNGDNSLVYISKSKKPCHVYISMHTDTTVFIGKDCIFDADRVPAKISVAEAQSVLIGKRCRLGPNVWIRTSDQHAIYDIETRKRIDPARSVILGNGSSIAEDLVILKGKKINVKRLFSRKTKQETVSEALNKTTDMDERIRLLKK